MAELRHVHFRRSSMEATDVAEVYSSMVLSTQKYYLNIKGNRLGNALKSLGILRGRRGCAFLLLFPYHSDGFRARLRMFGYLVVIVVTCVMT